MENTSGQDKLAVVPTEIDRWNWAAFLWGPIWAIGHKVWIGLLGFIPFGGWIMNIVLGVKGSQWAWQKNNYASVEQFKAKQKKWVKAWFMIWLTILALVVGVWLGMKGAPSKKDVATPQVAYQDKAQNAAQPPISQPFVQQYDYTAQIQRILKERPNDAKAFAEAGNIYFEQHKFIDAIEYYKKAVALDPNDVNSYNDLGLSYHYTNRPDEGLKYIEEGIKKNPTYQRIWLTKGFILAIRGNIADARGAWEKAYSLDPNTDIGRSAASFIEQYKGAAK